MAISEKNRKRFEGIGFEAVRRELAVGNNHYLPIDATAQAEAREWIAEQEKEIRETALARVAREQRSLKYTFWTLVAALAAVVVSIVGVLVTLWH